MTEAMTAMVLAAGYGERMRPLTLSMPKPLVRLAGRPLLDHVLDRLAASGVKTAIVNVHYLPEQLEAHLAARQGRPPELLVSDERGVLLDTGGGTKKALPLLGPGPFFIHNADSVWSEGAAPALSRMLRKWNPGAMDCLLLLAPTATSIGYAAKGDFSMDARGPPQAARQERGRTVCLCRRLALRCAIIRGCPRRALFLEPVVGSGARRG